MAGIAFEISPSACAGGGHFDVTATYGSKTLVRTYHKDELLEAPNSERTTLFC